MLFKIVLKDMILLIIFKKLIKIILLMKISQKKGKIVKNPIILVADLALI